MIWLEFMLLICNRYLKTDARQCDIIFEMAFFGLLSFCCSHCCLWALHVPETFLNTELSGLNSGSHSVLSDSQCSDSCFCFPDVLNVWLLFLEWITSSIFIAK